MSFPAYEEYKDSEVELLGEVPEHWETKCLRYVMAFSNGLTITKQNLEDEGVPCVNYGEIHSKYGFQLDPAIHSLRCVASEYLDSSPDALLNDGDFVFADTSEDLEGSGNFTHVRSGNRLFAGYHTIIGRPQKCIVPLFLAFQLDSEFVRSQIQRRVKGVKVFSVSQSILKSVKCWLPPPDEQTAIASFLDTETSKIDGLVSEQRRLIELLKEKRQAVISHAVTKGLNPDVKMKPSGIEWLGEVPEHWEVKPLKYLASFTSGGTPSKKNPVYWEGDVPWASSKDLKTETLADTIDHITQLALDEGAATLVPAGDVLVVVRGMILLHTFPVVQTLVPMAINQDLKALTPAKCVKESYLPWLLRGSTEATFSRVDEAAHGTKVLRMKAWTTIELPVPPVNEQTEIVNAIESQLQTLKELIAQAERSIELLQERRTALISAAVTGKIDVRGYKPEEAE